MTISEFYQWFRLLADDKAEPYRIENSDIDLFLAEAEKKAAQSCRFFSLDDTHKINVTANTASYNLANDIIAINSARLTSLPNPLTKTQRNFIDNAFCDWKIRKGIPEYYFIENSVLTLFERPNQDFVLELTGYRYPNQVLETPEHYQKDLVHWCLYRAYSIPDSDLFNLQKSEENLAKFTKAFGKTQPAWLIETQKTAALKNPFIRNQFN